MSTAFEVDSNIANIFSSQVPIVEGTYDLTPDQVLIDQAEHESEVRSYPRRLPIAIKQAFGCLVEDTRGQIFLDCLAGAGTLALGYNHPEINQALKEQLDSGLPYQTLDIATSAKTTFIQSVKSFLPQELSENSVIQFCGPSGADAVEAAIKLAKQTTGRNTMFTFRGAYHGMTNGTMGMMGNLGTKARRTGLMSDVHFMPFPYNLRCPFGLGGDEGAKASIRYIDRLLNDDESGIMKPAAIIVEPVQGEGGVVPAPAFWLRELRRICDEHGILLIFDEIQCGVGKTGYNFAFEESGIVPDILCLSKAIGGGLPMSLLVINKQHDTWKPGEHTGTFRGNQLAMVSGAKALEIIQRDNLVEHANIAGQYLRYGLESIQKRVNCIAEVRGKGLMLGVEIKTPNGKLNKFGEPQADSELTLSIQRAALERGLIVEKGGREGAVIRFLPPLIISFEQIDFALRVFEDAILAAGGSHIETQPQDEWKKHFIHTGEMGSNEFASVMNHTTTAMKSVFEQVTAPYSGMDPKALEAAIHDVDLDNGNAPLKSVIDDAAELVAKNAIFTQHPDCIAHLHTPPLMPAIAAEAMIAALNQSMDSWDQASSATYVEQKVVNWLCDKYELGAKADGIFTSGGTQSNQMGLMLARDWIADKLSAHSIQKLGLPEYADKLRIVCSKKSHFTVQKSASWMGLGEKAVMTVDANADGTMDVTKLDEVLNQAKAEGLIPFAIVGTAGTTDHGAIDDLDFIADMAAKHDMWMHVDGAYGGALILSSQKTRLKGCERAHSISVDFHKLFYQTISCGALLVNDKSNFKFLLHHADYLNREHDELPNLVDKSIATTKRFDALKVFMTMQSVGPKALGDMYDHLLEQTLEVADMIRDNKHFELLAEPSLSTVLFRATHESADLDELNKTLRLEALTRGIAVLGETIVDDKTALKFTILNPCLTTADFESLLSKINTLAAELV
ncbi:TPA: pyridoxal phosphate-dependent class III aminotransferase [Vibrio alginolyticus]|nr:pyridoxal phosphate-dependent class III aminotransferase [Vibrio alginolyticus]